MINDNIVERSETFRVYIDPRSLPYNVKLGTDSAVVVILDDDGKQRSITM